MTIHGSSRDWAAALSTDGIGARLRKEVERATVAVERAVRIAATVEQLHLQREALHERSTELSTASRQIIDQARIARATSQQLRDAAERTGAKAISQILIAEHANALAADLLANSRNGRAVADAVGRRRAASAAG